MEDIEHYKIIKNDSSYNNDANVTFNEFSIFKLITYKFLKKFKKPIPIGTLQIL